MLGIDAAFWEMVRQSLGGEQIGRDLFRIAKTGQTWGRRFLMSTDIPYAPHRAIDLDSLQQQAAQRDLPPGQEQRRDRQGQYQSHRDLPDTGPKDAGDSNDPNEDSDRE